ncbi:AAA family ATPase [Micromonospora sp. WMMD964]|uniref:AAA family ATPase n=1 Tax=Micromonospora sp. WMMD964 TaxID=3016091 RepID=UPI002499B5F9|nr:AAA family ATPase [Micromonospora sp. WMMD964]WFE98587.1 AAA family ATPase [Micromonospora sp. WMMD964]
MERDHGLEEILDQLDSEPAKAALRSWAQDTGVRLTPVNWSASGFTSARVFGVYAQGRTGSSKGTIIKVDTAPDRALTELEANQLAEWHVKPLRLDHLVRYNFPVKPLVGGGWITFQQVAGGGFDHTIGFDKIFEKHIDPGATCRAIIRSLLLDWNANTVMSGPMTAGRVLKELLGDRIEPGGILHAWADRYAGLVSAPKTWLRHLDGDLVNPFALATHSALGDLVNLYPFRGHTHGDLHPGNLLVATEAHNPPDYWLIDLSRYRPRGLLAWDPCYLMCTTIAMRLREQKALDKAALRDALLHPQTDDGKLSSKLDREMRQLISGIYGAEHEYANANGLLGDWPKQRLVCLTAIGLILSGRSLLTPADRQWFFWLAAHAATKLLPRDEIEDTDQLQLPQEFILPGADANASRSRPRRTKGGSAVPAFHEPARVALRKRLVDGPYGVVVVVGPRGVGKSTLVSRVLSGLDSSQVQVFRTPAVGGALLDTKTLIECIEGGTAPGAELRPGESSLARLEAALDAIGDKTIVIVVEDAQQLLGPGAVLTDGALDEAFEALSARPEHRVSVVLVTSVVPTSPSDGTWAVSEPPIAIARLNYDHFVGLLRERPGGSSRVRRLDDEGLSQLYRVLQGNPRLTNLFHAVCVLSLHRVRLRALVDELSGLAPREVPGTLLGLLLNDLEPPARRVLEALAAFRIPVAEEHVLALFDGAADEETLHALERLTDSMLVRRDGDRYELTDADADAILQRMDGGARDLSSDVAARLKEMRNRNPRTVADLAVHFAELRALIEAGEFESAYELLENIHDRLREVNNTFLLLDTRDTLRGRLGHPYLEMANESAIGGIHRSRGRFAEARAAYQRALAYAEQDRHEVAKLRIGANLAAMSWLDNDAEEAFARYRTVLDGAEQLGDPVLRMGGLEGLADCYRRWGRFPEAIHHVETAYRLPSEDGYPDTPTARRAAARRVTLALKLSRWHAELAQLPEARRWIEEAQRWANDSAGRWHRAALADGEADLFFWEGDKTAAHARAAEAVELAQQLHDPAILTRARTTLCLVHLENGELGVAAQEILSVRRYRRPGHSLVVLALEAVAARRQRRPTIASMRFRQLAAESGDRYRHDPRDFAAGDFRALAMCDDVLDRDVPVADAVQAFRESRSGAPESEGLRRLLRFLVSRIDLRGRPRGPLQPVLDELSATNPDHEPA